MKNIREFDDYREFIKDRLAEINSESKRLSFQNIANKLETTKSYLKLVIDKKRHMSLDKVLPLADFFEFSHFERQYFVFLFLKDTSKNKSMRTFFASILGSYTTFDRQNYEQQTTTDDKHNYIFRSWITMAILGLARRDDYKHDVFWIQDELGGPQMATKDQIVSSMSRLEEDGAIKESPEGWRRELPGIVNHVKPIDPNERQRFKTGLNLTSLVLDMEGKTDFHRPNRHQMYCLNLNDESRKELVAMYDALDRKLVELSLKETDAKKLFFIMNNFFAFSKD